MILWGTLWISKHLWCPLNTLNLSLPSEHVRERQEKKNRHQLICRMKLGINQRNAYFHLISVKVLFDVALCPQGFIT